MTFVQLVGTISPPLVCGPLSVSVINGLDTVERYRTSQASASMSRCPYVAKKCQTTICLNIVIGRIRG